MTATRAIPYLMAGAAGAGVGLAVSAQTPLLRAAPALAVVLAGACALAFAGGRWGLALILVAAFFPIPFRLFGAVVGPPDFAVGLVLIACAAGRINQAHPPRSARRMGLAIPRTPADWAISTMLIAAVISTFAVAVGESPVPLGASIKKVLQLAVSFTALYYFAASAARPRHALRFAVAVFLGVSALEGAFAVLCQTIPQQLGMTGLWPPYLADRASMRAMGTVDAGFGHYMAAALVLALALVSPSAEPARPLREDRLRLLAVIALPVLAAGLISSGTRGSAVAAGAGILMLLVFHHRRGLIPAALAASLAPIGLVGSLLGGVASPQKIALLFTSHGGSNLSVRLLSWGIGWNLAIAHPWLGIGPGANALTIEALLGIPAEALRYVEGTMNAYLQAFLETGVAGLAGLIGFIALSAGSALTHSRGRDPLAVGLGAAVCTLGVTGITGPLLIGGIGHLLFALAGLAAASVTAEDDRP